MANVTHHGIHSMKFKIMTEDMGTAADIVQDLSTKHNIEELTSNCSFSRVRKSLEEIKETVEQSNLLKTHFAANISENI